jgi:stage II sporulation protein R
LLRVKTAKPHLITLIMLCAMVMSEMFCGACLAALLGDEQTAFNTTNLIRLHIMANSDSPEDQALKLAIRDTVLMEVKGLLVEATTKYEVWQILSESLKKIEDAARNEIGARGKCYGDLQVPAGDYDAIRVMLGSGTGRNWWCVLFPPLCFIEVADDGKIQGLDTSTSPGEALLRLDLSLKTSYSAPWDLRFRSTIPVLERFAFSRRLSLSLRDLL